MAPLTHWHILGEGSIGCLFAYYLSQAGHDVTLIASPNSPAASKTQTITIDIDNKKHKATVNRVNAEQAQAINYLLICTKAHQTIAALENIKHAIHKNTVLCLLQNGMGVHELISNAFPENRLHVGITTEAALRTAPHDLIHTGYGETFFSKRGDTGISEQLQCASPISDLNPKELERLVWRKFVVNCCINPLTVLFNCKNGELANIEQSHELIHDIIEEAKAVCEKSGQADYLAGIEEMVFDVIKKTANNYSSMYEDVRHKRETEIDYLNNHLVKLASNLGLNASTNQTVVSRINQ